MNKRFVYVLLQLFVCALCINAQGGYSTPDFYFQEDDTIDIYLDETVTIKNYLNKKTGNPNGWQVMLSGNGFDYAIKKDTYGSFSFTPPKYEVDDEVFPVRVYEFNVRYVNLSPDQSEVIIDTTKTFVIRAFSKPYANMVVMTCDRLTDVAGQMVYSLTKNANVSKTPVLTTYSDHYVKVTMTDVTGIMDYWTWWVNDISVKADEDFFYKYSEAECHEDGMKHNYKVKVRYKLPYRKEAYEAEYEFICDIYPNPEVGLSDYVDTYSGRTAGFNFSYSGGVKDLWTISWSDLNGNRYTPEEMNNLTFTVDKPTMYEYRLYVKTGNDNIGYYYGISYPVMKVWEKPFAEFVCPDGCVADASAMLKEYNISCVEGQSLPICFDVKGGYISKNSWVAEIDTFKCEYADGKVTCNYVVNVPSSMEYNDDGICEYSVYAYVKNLYTGWGFSPDSIWYSDSVKLNAKVIRDILPPVKLVKKGSGYSGTVVAFLDKADVYSDKPGYMLVYGYEDKETGAVTESMVRSSEDGSYRAFKFQNGMLNVKAFRFYVYARYEFSDGNILDSGRCYMDEESESEAQGTRSVHSMDGRITSEPKNGMYIIRMSDGTVKKQFVK